MTIVMLPGPSTPACLDEGGVYGQMHYPSIPPCESGKDQLTARQTQVLRFIAEYHHEHGFSPSYREIGAHLGIRSTYAVECHLDVLKRKGWIRRDWKNTSRTITVVT